VLWYSQASREIEKKKVVLRIDIDSPIIENDFLIKEKVLRYKKLIEELKYRKAKVFVLFEVGTTRSRNNRKVSIKEISEILAKIFDIKINYPNKPDVSNLQYFLEEILPGEFLFWENLALTEEEENKNSKLFNKIKEWADFFIDDSINIIPKQEYNSNKIKKDIQTILGPNFEKEITLINNIISSPKHPIVFIIGGIQIEQFIVENLLPLTYKADYLLFTGAWVSYYANKFYGVKEDELIDKKGIKIFDSINKDFFKRPNVIFPEYVKVYHPISLKTAEMPMEFIKEGLYISDLGEKTLEQYEQIIENAGTIVWLGATSKYWIEPNSTLKIANAVSKKISNKIISGDDLMEALYLTNYDGIYKFDIVYGDGHTIIDFILNKNYFDYNF